MALHTGNINRLAYNEKVVLGLSALVATYFGFCVSQCDVNAQVSAQLIVKLVESDAFRRVELQHLPYDVLKTMDIRSL
ncbi:MAG: hypothetical protein V8T12_12100 [Parabacteroides johnsonii]